MPEPEQRGDALRVIVGPTAAGKSALAMALAAHVPLTIISADSRQVYRGFDIGTAKPSATERAQVPHEAIDVCDPTERFSAHAWAALARDTIAHAEADGRTPVIVGGTGLYVRALVAPLAPVPPLPEAPRAALTTWLAQQPPELVRDWCARLDPPRAALGPAQWRRAVEVALLTGRPLSAWHAEYNGPPPLPVRYLVVDPGEPLRDRIEARVHAMWDAGWPDEVRSLTAAVPADAPAWQATGYDVVRACVAGTLSVSDATERITHATRQYAKRQRTWFRGQLGDGPVSRVSPDAPDVLDRVLAWWAGHEYEGVV